MMGYKPALISRAPTLATIKMPAPRLLELSSHQKIGIGSRRFMNLRELRSEDFYWQATYSGVVSTLNGNTNNAVFSLIKGRPENSPFLTTTMPLRLCNRSTVYTSTECRPHPACAFSSAIVSLLPHWSLLPPVSKSPLCDSTLSPKPLVICTQKGTYAGGFLQKKDDSSSVQS